VKSAANLAAIFAKAIQKGVRIALGSDAGAFDWKKFNQAKENVKGQTSWP
jgi:hypothetical protein